MKEDWSDEGEHVGGASRKLCNRGNLEGVTIVSTYLITPYQYVDL